MKSGRAWWLHLWPQHLMRQVFAVVAVIILSCGVIYSLIAERRISGMARTNLQSQALALAHSVASGGALHLVTGDATALENLLLQSAAYPGILSILVADPAGRVVAAVKVNSDGTVKPDFESRTIALPTTAAGPLGRIVSRDNEDIVEAFTAIHNGRRIGWVRADLGLERAREISASARLDALFSATIISILTLSILYLFFDRALRPLSQCARFASKLGHQLGHDLRINGGSVEINNLVNALNFASHELKAKLAELAQSEALTQSVLDTAADAIIGFELDGKITFINPAGCHIFGTSADALQGQKLEYLLPEVNDARIALFTENGIMTGGSSALSERLETQGLRNGGVPFPAEVALGLLNTEQGPRLTCIARDVTEKQIADDSLRLFSRAVECSANGVVIVDLAYPGLPITYANAAFERITGYRPDEVIGQNCRLLQGNGSSQAEISILRNAVASGTEATVTLRNYRKDGSPFWNELSIAPVRAADGNITHFVGIQSDVTKARLATQNLAEHSARLDAVFSMSPDGFVLFERPGKVVAMNRAFSLMTGIGQDDAQGLSIQSFNDLLHKRCDPQATFPRIAEMDTFDGIAYDVVSTPATVTVMQPERRILQRHIRLTEGGHEMILFYRDVTRETEVDRMKSEFLSTAAHELRTPMVSIYGFSELLLKRKYPEERQKQFIETIYRQTGSLVKLVNELLDLARIEARAGKDFKIETQPLSPIVHDTAMGLCITEGRQPPSIDLPNDLPLVAVDPEKFRQALLNVLSNAYKYSRQGAVCVSTLRRTVSNRPQIGILIQDEGIGMTPEQVSRAFERFFRADASGNIPGTGLGLCLVKEIVELHGGTVELDSEWGKGTSVTLWLPVVECPIAIAA